MPSSMLDWPEGFSRTPEAERENTTKFSANYSQTKSELDREMDRLGVEAWTMDDVTGSGGDPGVVVRWRKNDRDYAVACDAYTNKGDNLRALYLWLNETRMRNQRPVETGQDQMAAAQLPSGEEAAVAEAPPHKVLGVEPDAPRAEVVAAFRQQAKAVHPDTGAEDDAAFKRLKEARDAMLDQ